MSRIVYVNGRYLNEEAATISIFDRGFLFSDAVYEVTAVINGRLFESDGHLARLQRSCAELNLTLPLSLDEIVTIEQELIEKNNLIEGGLYLQLSRGNSGDREFDFPPASVTPTLVLFTQARAVLSTPIAEHGIKIITVPDIRWQRRNIKVVSLLAACLAKQQAHEAGADDAFLVEAGYITEGSSSNAYIVDKNGVIITRALSSHILPGITRKALLQLSQQYAIQVEERAFSVAELKSAQEVFLSSATSFITPVIAVDGVSVGSGRPGPVTQCLRRLYVDLAKQATR